MKKNLTSVTIKLFNKAIPTFLQTHSNRQILGLLVEKGYLVPPVLYSDDILDWAGSQSDNYNTTFYKKRASVTEKTRQELFTDQVQHYASTYGTGFKGEVYLPEEAVTPEEFTSLKVIMPMTKVEAIEKCYVLLSQSIALSQETIEDVLFIFNELGLSVDIKKVNNKEAKMFLYKHGNILPDSPQEMVRFLVFLATGKTDLIVNNETIAKIKATGVYLEDYVTNFGYEKLSSVFLRFKPLFLAFKHQNKSNATVVNKLRKLAVKNHVPLKQDLFRNFLSSAKNITRLDELIATTNNFQKVSLLQTIAIRLKNLENSAYVVRNQKLFIKPNSKEYNKLFYKLTQSGVYDALVDSLKAKACKVKLAKGVNITLPTSEKSFVGNYPLGTSFDFSKDNCIFGIYWKGNEGAHDLDLSLMDLKGNKIGWNSSYVNKEKSIVYSGDMTWANPEATELIFAKNGFVDSIAKVNMYNGNMDAKFKFFLAKEAFNDGKPPMNHMVSKDNILIEVDCKMDSQEKSLGVISNNKFILAQFRTGKGNVSRESVTDLYTKYAVDIADTYVSLKKLLTAAGFEFVTDDSAEIDFNEIDKSTLINLLC